MDKIKKIYSSTLDKYGIKSNGNDNLPVFWKMLISFYLLLFVILMLVGWLFYSWVVTSEIIIPKTKNIRSEITIDDVNKVKEITEGRKNKLDEIIKSDVKAIEMK